MEHGRISTECSRFRDTKGASCPFLENDKISTYREGLAERYSEMYVSVMRKLMLKACNTIYYFNGLLSIRSSEVKIRSRFDGGAMYSTEWQKNDLVVDDLITAIKTIHEAIRDKDTQKEKFKKEFSCIDGGEYEPRRNIFVKSMHNILDGIYEIKSYSKQCPSNVSIIKKSSLLKNAKEKCDTVRLLFSDNFAKIEQLYAHQVGWSFLLNDTNNNIESGFYISEETKTYIINKLKNARESVQKWFQMIIKRDEWQNSSGYWKIDFDSKVAVFIEQHNSNCIMNKMGFSEKTQVPDGNSFAIPDGNGFSMILGDRDFEIAFSIHETVGALLDMVRYKIRKVVEGTGSEEELSEYIYKLGRAVQLKDKWYHEMGTIYNWPEGILLGFSEMSHSVSVNILPRTKMSKNEWEAIHGR